MPALEVHQYNNGSMGKVARYKEKFTTSQESAALLHQRSLFLVTVRVTEIQRRLSLSVILQIGKKLLE